MKRIIAILSSSIILCLLPLTTANSQEKNSEQKIKIVVADGSGTKIVIDTLIKDGHAGDTIRLKDGKMIFIGDSGDKTFMKHSDGSGHVYVYTSKDEKKKDNTVKTITVLSSDNVSWSENNEESFESSDDVTRSIIAKDGIVVTVEGKDEAKVKELAKEIHQKMGIKPGEEDAKNAAKVKTNK